MSTTRVAPTAEQIRQWILDWLAREFRTTPMEIAAAANFVALGISSRQAVTLTADLGDWLELDLPPNLLFVRQDLAALVGFLSESLGARG